MTVITNVKSCLASLKGASATMSNLAVNIIDEEGKVLLLESVAEIDQIIDELAMRIGVLEQEEPQYKGF